MFRTALRNVLAHKARLLMTVLAVMLGVAFVAGTLVFTSTLSHAFQKSSEKGFAQVDVALRPDESTHMGPGEAARLSQKLLDRAERLPGAGGALGEVSGFAALADKDGKLVGQGWSTRGGNYYAGKDGRGTDFRYPVKDGRAPQRAGEIMLDARTAERTGYQVGDTVRMSVDGPVRQEKVVGVFTTDDGGVAAGGTLVLFDTRTAQSLFTKPGEYEQIILTAAKGTSQAQLLKQVEESLPKEVEATTGKTLADEQARMIDREMSGMRTFMLVFAGISLFVGVFIIANTFTMLVAQRTKELALMRAVGASRRQVTRSVLLEAGVVGTIAAVIGLVTGIGIAVGLRALLNAFDLTVPDGPLLVGTDAVVASLVVGIGVTMLAAWLPARRAAKIPPVAAMSSVHATPTTRSLVVRNTIGSILFAAGAALVLLATGMGFNEAQAPMALGACVLVVGVFVLTPLLSRPLIAAAGPVLRAFGVSGKLARQNAVRNPRRTAATASALMIGLTLITGLTVVAGSSQQAINKMAADSLKADYTLSMANYRDLSPEVEKTLRDLPDVTALSPLRRADAEVDGTSHWLSGVSGKDVGKLVNLDFDSGSFAGLADGGVLVDRATAKENDWKRGSTLKFTFEDGKREKLTVAGVYRGNEMMQGLMMDTSVLDPHTQRPSDAQVMVKLKDGVSAAGKDRVAKALGENPAILIQSKQDIADATAQEFTIMLNMLYGLLAMAVVVAVLGVVNTLAMSVFERSQEIGMLRAIGLDRKSVKRMVRLESIVIALFGGVMGVGLGLFFGWAVGELLGGAFSTYSLVVPWDRIALFLTLAAAVGVLAALWPARRAARMNMLAAIKSE
ncbi:ABC transporter permease [Streptomyces alkaliterrae]|uniref:ABC transporter permease n=1 Tax=Streptomyces alkaliterrae TaxID=2213162 RepID=A0A5P0Z095_9ACTN|nr:ABC transporter permease [Streptomyces alkaliterrae]MBB1256577.1 ABC transporter permease [Streptomyces alkaliterrae]MBB1262273.1 ABC transporter permease [Streptomyces alkaliterrae]MQS04969.1 FtsX-like permease family protein [Streptomyces alkaliterrae]